MLKEDLLSGKATVAVVGLGYVGLPLAVALGKKLKVIGFDIHSGRIALLKANEDPSKELSSSELLDTKVDYTSDAARLKEADFIIVAVPTPIDNANNPDLSPVLKASATIGKNLKKNAIVVFESTVYPDVTEEVCGPEIEKHSGLKCGEEFKLGYSPERINPGDKEHTLTKITKIVSAQDSDTLDVVAAVYGSVVEAGLHLASSIKVAEAAKVIENTQRDLNIALINELSLIFDRLGIDTMEVLKAAGTKWNFLRFTPGLVGGHCIGVDPYYLTHKAKEVGYNAEVILAGRRINDSMGKFVAGKTVKLLIQEGIPVKGETVIVMGLTFKENVSDIRNTRVIDIIRELEDFGVHVIVTDAHADADETHHEYGVQLTPFEKLPKARAVILATAHDAYRKLDVKALKALYQSGANPILIDVRRIYDKKQLEAAGIRYWGL